MIPFILILITSLLLTGIINKGRSIISGRKGYAFFQPLFSVMVLLRKGSVYSSGSTAITQLAAPLYLSSIVVAGLCIPFGTLSALISFRGDLILFVSLMVLSRLALVFGALDSGSSMQGMGVSRELLFGTLAEPAFFLFFGTLAMITGCYSFSDIFAQFDNISINLLVLSVLVGYGFFKLALSECGRQPVDDTATHLELTMVHEVMVLDFSGVDLAFVKIGQWLKLSIFGLLVANSLIPAQINGWGLAALFVVTQFIFAVMIAIVESLRARNRMNKNATFIATIIAVGLLSIVVAYILTLNILV